MIIRYSRNKKKKINKTFIKILETIKDVITRVEAPSTSIDAVLIAVLPQKCSENEEHSF